MKAQEFDRLANKLGMRTRNSGDRLAWFEYNGKVITRTRRSMGSGDVPLEHCIRQQLKVNEDQLRGLVSCTVSKDDYISILKAKGLIQDP